MPVENEGDVSPLLEFAQKIDQPADVDDKKQTTQEPFDPENPPMPQNIGSFEGFMGSFGAPTRWAGR